MAPIKTFLLAFLAATTIIAAPLKARQLAGEGAAADSILSDTDNGVGYGTENAEDNTANLITSLKGGAALPAVPGQKIKRQGDKIANGAANVISAAGAPGVASTEKTAGDNLDADLTSGAANLGADAGATEESTLEDAGSAVPK
jgi:hypothetical protein